MRTRFLSAAAASWLLGGSALAGVIPAGPTIIYDANFTPVGILATYGGLDHVRFKVANGQIVDFAQQPGHPITAGFYGNESLVAYYQSTDCSGQALVVTDTSSPAVEGFAQQTAVNPTGDLTIFYPALPLSNKVLKSYSPGGQLPCDSGISATYLTGSIASQTYSFKLPFKLSNIPLN